MRKIFEYEMMIDAHECDDEMFEELVEVINDKVSFSSYFEVYQKNIDTLVVNPSGLVEYLGEGNVYKQDLTYEVGKYIYTSEVTTSVDLIEVKPLVKKLVILVRLTRKASKFQ